MTTAPATLTRPTPPPLPPEDATDGGLTAEQLQQWADANLRARKVLKAAKVAAFNGWTVGFFAAASAIFALFSIPTALLCAGLAFVTYNEFRGRKLLLRFEPRATRVLGWNQLVLMGLLIAYGAWHIGAAYLGPSPYEQAIRTTPQLEKMLRPVENLYTLLTVVVYGGVIVGTMIFQALNAAYYFTRAKRLRAYLAETPDWIVDLQRQSHVV